MAVLLVLLVVLGVAPALLLTGCPETTTWTDGGDGSVADTGLGVDPLGDEDSDGLCNMNEINRATDVFGPDTDDDGFSDFVEVAFGYNPLIPAIPQDDEVFELLAEPGATVRVPVALVIRGAGEDYTGAFEAFPAQDANGLTADDFWQGSIALFADPTDNVAVVEAEAQVFRGVVGTTELNFETTFTFEGGDRFEPCLRGYPFRYLVKRSDGRVLAAARALLVVVPPTNTGEWCAPALPCL